MSGILGGIASGLSKGVEISQKIKDKKNKDAEDKKKKEEEERRRRVGSTVTRGGWGENKW